MIRKTVKTDLDAIIEIVKESGHFDENALAHVRETLESYLAGESDDLWLTADDGEPVGVAYVAPEPVTDGTWNLLMLWTRSDRHGRGHGSALVTAVESSVSERRGRLLIVETSGLPDFETARNFYDQCGFTQEARVKDFFAAGDDKLIYTKTL